MTKKPNWEQLKNNSVLNGNGFYISYNPNTALGNQEFTILANILGLDRKDGEETALCLVGGGFRILNGDFRKEYEKAFPDLKKCLAVYEKNKAKFRNNWSTDNN